ARTKKAARWATLSELENTWAGGSGRNMPQATAMQETAKTNMAQRRREAEVMELAASPSGILNEPGIGAAQPFFQADAGTPAQGFQPADVQQFAWRAIRLAGIPRELAREPGDFGDSLRQFPDGAIHPGAHVD